MFLFQLGNNYRPALQAEKWPKMLQLLFLFPISLFYGVQGCPLCVPGSVWGWDWGQPVCFNFLSLLHCLVMEIWDGFLNLAGK